MAIMEEVTSIGGYGGFAMNKAKEVETIYNSAANAGLKFNPEKLYIGLINAVYRGDKLELEITKPTE